MKKIILLNPPGKRLFMRAHYCSGTAKANSYWPPIDLLVFSGYLKEYEIKVMDDMVLGINFEESLKNIINFKPDFIISLTAECSWKNDFKFFKKIKDNLPKVKIILSGDFLLQSWKKILNENKFIDVIVLSFITNEIVDYIENKKRNYKDIVDQKNVDRFKREIKKGEFEYPLPQHEKFPIGKYRSPLSKQFPFTTILTSMGCPNYCKFCIGGTIKYRVRNIKNIIDEIKYIKSLGINELHITDFNFLANKNHSQELCREMIKNNLKVTWDCLARVDNFDEETLDLMKKAGCHLIQIGIESGDDKLLKDYFKKLNTNQIKQAVELCKKKGIMVLGFFIIGLPGETKESALKTIRFAKKLDCDFCSFAIAAPFTGTKNEGRSNRKRMDKR